MPKAGDHVLVQTDDEIIEGTVMPNVSDNLVLKLKSGYNIGISQDRIKQIKATSKHRSSEKKRHHVLEKDPKKKTISILHTGGTIASKVDYETGAVFTKFSPEELIALIPELQNIANIDSRLIAQMWSEDMRFEEFKKIAKAIEEEVKKKVDGIIITHGTDTLGYSAAALAFMCESLPIPVIFVAAQRSSDRGSTDGPMNLICATQFIASTEFVGVGICMHETQDDSVCVILPPTKTRKMHTSRRDAFNAINDTPIARIHYQTKEIEFLKDFEKKSSKNPIFKIELGEKVALLKMFPNISKRQIDFFKTYNGVVIEGFGLGQAAINPPDNIDKMKSIQKLIKNGTIVVMTSQCISGRTHPHVYSTAVKLKEAGVIYVEDMLPETAFIKLAWLLGNYSKEEAKHLMTQNLRGEISERTIE